MRLASADEARRIDELATQEYQLPGEILMEAAGSLAAREIEQSFFPELRRGKIVIVCGPGNNGADGLVAARHLHAAGFREMQIGLVAPEGKQTDLFQLQLDRVFRLGIELHDFIAHPENIKIVDSAELIIDAVFGISVTREVQSPFREVIEAMNRARASVVSLDVPSGLDCDRGNVMGVAVKAKQTLAFGLAKPGFFVNEGPAHVGRLRVVSIGYPYELIRKVAVKHFAFTEKLARRYLPARAAQSNKSDFGHALVFAGRDDMLGAAVLSASSAARMGAGYVTLASNGDARAAISQFPEMILARPDDIKIWSLTKWTAAAIGPGFGTGQETFQLLERLASTGKPIVVDADALTTIAEFPNRSWPSNWIMTPHAGELARMLGVDPKTIEADRYEFASLAARKFGCHVLLKGFRSILAYGNRTMVILAGNSALAKAGSGDVLTGMIVGLLSQGVSPLQAAATAAYIHGRMADEWVKSGNDRRSLQPSDLRDLLPGLLSRISVIPAVMA